jgi:hypothetical protein
LVQNSVRRRLAVLLAALAVGGSVVAVPAVPASAFVHEYVGVTWEGEKVVREAWLNYDDEGGLVRAYGRVYSIFADKVGIKRVCLQNEAGVEQCGGSKYAVNQVLHVHGDAWRCTPGRHYRSIVHWESAGGGAAGSGVAASHWWRCP